MKVFFQTRYKNYIQKVPVTIVRQGTNFVLTFPYNKQVVDEVRSMAGARWNPDEKQWTIKICERNLYAIRYATGYRPDKYFTEYNINNITSSRPLFDFQKEAIAFILQRCRCMLAYEMGLGKTLVGIEVMERTQIAEQFVWWLVAPKGAQKEWQRQFKKWNAKVIPTVITTYESLGKVLEAATQPPSGVIFDESIKLKNPNSQRSQIAAELTRLIRHNQRPSYIILFSGAPAPKSPVEWWNQIECIFPGWLREGDTHKFIRQYADIEMQDGEFGTYPVITGWKEPELIALGKRLSPICLVKRRKDCLELPDKIFEQLTCSEAASEESLRVAQVLTEIANSPIEALEKVRELSDGFQYRKIIDKGEEKSRYDWVGSPKLDVIKELLDFYHTDNGGPGRLVIYAAFHASIDKLVDFAKQNQWDPYKIDGRGWSDPETLEVFETDSASQNQNVVIVANPACVHGLTLTRTFALIYYSNSFSTDARIQSMDRRDRPGIDVTKGTRIIDIINLPTDRLIVDRLTGEIGIQNITLEEIKRCLQSE